MAQGEHMTPPDLNHGTRRAEYHVPIAEHMSQRRIVLIWAFTCCAAPVLGGILGLLACIEYGIGVPDQTTSRLSWAGLISGAASGLVVAVIWCQAAFAWYRRDPQRFRIRRGAFIGVAAGLLSAAAVHVSLSLAAGFINPICVQQGVGFGLAAGMLLGAFCAALFPVPTADETTR